MKPIGFPKQNCVYAENQPGYLPLPAHKTADGMVTSCWTLTRLERLRVLFTGRIWWQALTFNQPLQPQRPCATNPITEKGGENDG